MCFLAPKELKIWNYYKAIVNSFHIFQFQGIRLRYLVVHNVRRKHTVYNMITHNLLCNVIMCTYKFFYDSGLAHLFVRRSFLKTNSLTRFSFWRITQRVSVYCIVDLYLIPFNGQRLTRNSSSLSHPHSVRIWFDCLLSKSVCVCVCFN